MRALLLVLVVLSVAAALVLLRGHETVPTDPTLDRGVDASGREPDLSAPASDLSSTPWTPTEGDVGPAPAARPPGLALEGVVVDPAGRPVAGAHVQVARLDLRALRGGRAGPEEIVATAPCDLEGRFRVVPGISATWYQLTARQDGYATGTAWAAGSGTWVEIRLAVASGLSVLALDAAERPVADAAVEIDVGRVRLVGTTDRQGRASFADVPPGGAFVRVESSDGHEGRTGPLPVSPTQANEAVVWVRAPVLLSGRVLDAEDGLPLSDAEVHVARPGQALKAGPTREDGVFPAVPAGPPGTRVMLAARADGYEPVLISVDLPDTDDVHAVELRLRRAPPWIGRVLDAEDRPVEAARVTTTHDGVAGRAPPVVLTDEDGRFSLPPPPPPAPGRQVVLTATATTGRAALALRRGQPQPKDLVLRLTRGVVVAGRVVGADGKALAGAAVRLDPAWRRLDDRRDPGPATSRLLAMNQRGRGRLQTASDASGYYRIEDVPDGWFRLRLLHGSRQTRTPDPFEVAGKDVAVGTLAMDTGLTLAGEVRRPDGSRLPGASVSVSVEREDGTRLVQRGTTVGDGGFEIQGLIAGTAAVRVDAPGTLGARTTFELPHADPVLLHVEEGARILGVVRDGERPFTGLYVLHVEREDGRRSRLRPSTHRGKDGRFVRTGLPPGTWRLRVEAPGGRIATTPTPIEIAGPGIWEVQLDLAHGATLSGRLTSPAGQPIAGGRIQVEDEEAGLGRAVTSARDGRYRIAGLPAGPYRIRAEGPGGARMEMFLHVVAGERRQQDLELAPAGRVEVRVMDARGTSVEGAVILVRDDSGALVRGATLERSDAQGRALLHDLPVGMLEILARTRTGMLGRATVEVQAGTLAKTEVILRKDP